MPQLYYAGSSHQSAAELRATLSHPVIDVDGHTLEFLPTLDEYLRQAMGSQLFEVWLRRQKTLRITLDERRRRRLAQSGWWTAAPITQPYDRAAASIPRLLRTRMDEFGIDFMVLYTSAGLGPLIEPNEEIRRAFCWALNEYYSDHYLAFGDRMTPAGVIPMYTPEEALGELDHCHLLGLKVVQLPHGIPRPIPQIHEANPDLYPAVHWLDTFGVDSAFDYGAVWQHLLDQGFAATFHGHSTHAAATRTTRSITNYVFNHLGAHASLMMDLCKSLLLGGVATKFAHLPLAFLEGGVHWASALLNDFVEHWEKRNLKTIEQYDPRCLDVDQMQRLFQEWGNEITKMNLPDRRGVYANRREGPGGDSSEPACYDDFRSCEIERLSDIATLFANLYFGCEADDATVSFAYHPCNALGLRLRAMFSSDFGHWDAPRGDQLLLQSYKLVERGLLSGAEFQTFVADNAIKLHGTVNSAFWNGTSVDRYARTVLANAGLRSD
jgi:predicted TIM-barrel fold metal-dependent hydrolase